MTKPKEIIEFLENKTNHQINDDEGFRYGPRNCELTGITVAWTVNAEVIESAVKNNHNCIVHHEALTYPYPGLREIREMEFLSWPTNYNRLALLSKYDITTIRLHESCDEVYIYNAFASQLQLGPSIDNDDSGIYSHKVFASPIGTFGGLVEHVKKSMNMTGLRTTNHELNMPIKRIGLPWGGLGLFVNVEYIQSILDIGVDVLICGETDNYGFRFAAEAGVAVIETSHELSEACGLELFAADLKTHLMQNVKYYDIPCVWGMR